jgi:hypothetical protein
VLLLSFLGGLVAECGGSEKVNAADFGYNATNATAALQSAIDSGAKTVVIDASKGDWCIEPIKLRSNVELIFAENVRVRAVPGAFRKRYDMMFKGMNVTNIKVRGMSGASIEMFKKDYLDSDSYIWSEWRHMFAFYDSANISVEGLSLSSSGGDGVYIARCKDVRLENLICAGHDRQGISVIGAENLLVRRCRFCFTEGTPPQCGIDFEPNSAKEYFVNCLIEDCDFDGNFSHGALFHIPHMNNKSRPISVKFRNCRFSGNRLNGVRVHATWNAEQSVRGGIEFDKCVFAANRNGGITLASMPPKGFTVDFKNSIIDSRGCSQSPIVFDNGELQFDFGGVSFSNVTVYADTSKVISFHGMTGVGVTNVAGDLSVVTPTGSERLSLSGFAAAHPSDPSVKEFKPTFVKFKKLVALKPDTKSLSDTAVFCRGRQFFVQTVPSAGKHVFKFLTRQTSNHDVEVKVDISDKVGTPVDSFVVNSPEKEYVLESAKENTYLFTVNSRGNECAVVSSLPGQGIRADSRVRLCAREGRNFWFVVPAASTKVELEVIASVSSPLSAKILDSLGKELVNLDKIREGHIVKIPRKQTSLDEIWCLSVSECLGRGCFDLRIGGNAISVISGTRDAVLCY